MYGTTYIFFLSSDHSFVYCDDSSEGRSRTPFDEIYKKKLITFETPNTKISQTPTLVTVVAPVKPIHNYV
jgi:hypothetical protein